LQETWQVRRSSTGLGTQPEPVGLSEEAETDDEQAAVQRGPIVQTFAQAASSEGTISEIRRLHAIS
jgi:hypothetical protein